MKRFFINTAYAVLAALCLFAGSAHASVVIGGTRVVFLAQQGETTVRLSNESDKPALVEAWIDDGDVQSTPDTARTPFLITPPLFRMEAHKDQSLRILYVQGTQPLPGDRESVFWLNVLEIPPKPGAQYADRNYLQFAIRSRLKLFYRPANLHGNAATAPDQLTFKVAAPEHDTALVVHNPTPYYITIVKLSLGSGGQSDLAAPGMVAPFSDLQLTLKDVAHAPAPGTPLVFTTINDYGADDVHKGAVVQ